MGPGFSSADEPAITVWHGEVQRVGHLGDAQDDFNVMGHIGDWEAVDRLFWSVNGRGGSPMQFRAYRRLVEDGDFNADIPIAWLRPGVNTVKITASMKDGSTAETSILVHKLKGNSTLPFIVDWDKVSDPQEIGQYVDGRWKRSEKGLRTAQVGYDRLFLLGERTWRDYEIRTSITLHQVTTETSPISGGNGVGIIWRFSGHVVGGPRHFPAAQPKWGYQPFGAIGWLRWPGDRKTLPYLQFYPGCHDQVTNYGRFPYEREKTYHLRLRCETLPDSPEGEGVSRYCFKIWPEEGEEPNDWTWEHVQTSRHALRRGGPALVAHHVDATFGDITVTSVDSPQPSEKRSEWSTEGNGPKHLEKDHKEDK